VKKLIRCMGIVIFAHCVFLSVGEAASNRVLNLVDPNQGQHISENVLSVVATFYGLPIDRKSILSVPFDSTIFFDSEGNGYPLVGMSDFVLESLDTTKLATLKQYLINGGVVILFDVLEAPQFAAHAKLISLSNRLVQGSQFRGESQQRALIFSSATPSLTDVFTGLKILYPSNPDMIYNRALVYQINSTVTPVISSIDSNAQPFVFFLKCQVGNGNLYVSSAYQAHTIEQMQTFFNARYGAEILPSMLVIKSLYGERAWHGSDLFANLTIDDPALRSVTGQLDFRYLLNEMIAHKFHTTIAYVPQNYILGRNESSVEKLFVSNPEYYSIVQHGDFHTPYEFFGYTSEDSATLCLNQGLCGYSPVPYSQQELLIVEGLTKLSIMQKNLGLPLSRVMVFPWGNGPLQTLGLLDRYDYNALESGAMVPFLSSNDSGWDAWMRPANNFYESFQLFFRIAPYIVSNNTRNGSNFSAGVFDLFLGKPALYVLHPTDFIDGESGFGGIADSLNTLALPVEWKSLDDIATHLYLSKKNMDGTDSVWIFGNKTYIKNEDSYVKNIRLRKRVEQPSLISQVTVGGASVPFLINGEYLFADITLKAHSEVEVDFLHEQGTVDYSIAWRDIYLQNGGLNVMVHNLGYSAGICSAVLIDSLTNTPLSVCSSPINGHDSALVFFDGLPVSFSNVWLLLNPLDIGHELNTADNSLHLSFLSNDTTSVVDNFEYSDSPLHHGWVIATSTISGDVETVYDSVLNSRVMDVETPYGTQFRVDKVGKGWWRNGFSVKMKTSAPFVFYVRCIDSAANQFYVQYTPDNGSPSKDSSYVYYHIGTKYLNGKWNILSRNIDADLAAAGWHSRLGRIMGFLIRGSLYADDLMVISESVNSVGESSSNVEDFRLMNNYPNPFNPGTTIKYQLSEQSTVHLKIYNIIGQLVKTLVRDANQPVGVYTVRWEGDDTSGKQVGNGVFIYRFEAYPIDGSAPFVGAGKMMLLK
jgi:hypothetical protein